MSWPLRGMAFQPEIVGDYDYDMCTSPPTSPRPVASSADHHVSSLATRLPQAMVVTTAPGQSPSLPGPFVPGFSGMPAQSHWPSWQPPKPGASDVAARKRALDHEACYGSQSQSKRAALQEQQQWRCL